MNQLDLDYFEIIFTYKCLTDEIYLASVLDYVDPKYFKNEAIRDIFGIIEGFYSKRSTVPTLTEIKSYLTTDDLKKSFRSVVSLFTGIDKNFNSDELLANTEKFLKEKAVYTTLLDVVNDMSKNAVDVHNIYKKFEKACSVSLNHDSGIDLIPQIDQVIAHITADTPCIKTPWKWLDEKIGGGWIKDGRALYAFAGETNVGKSIFLGNVAESIADSGRTVVVISLEMSEMMYAKRLCSNITQIPVNNLRAEAASLKSCISVYKNQVPNARIIIKEFPPNTITVNHLNGFLKKLVARGVRPDAIVVDYANLFTSSTGDNGYERIKYVTEQLRALSYIYTCPVITATQLNRCLAVNSIVESTNKKLKRIDQLRVGDEIKGRVGYVTVRYIYPKEKQKCVKITTKSGKVIICSKNHLFPTSNGIKSVNIGLRKGDRLMSLNESQA